MIHRYLVWLHRWTGLLMAGFLVLVGLTGSLLAFRSKLDRMINPELYVNAQPGQKPLDLATLAERAESVAPESRLGYYVVEEGQVLVSMMPRTSPATGETYKPDYDHLILDPYTGRELGRYRAGDLSQGRVNLMTFIYDLHTSLATRTSTGWMIVGIVALIWTLDCFVGFYLTLPRGAGGFWKRWKVAWQVKWNATTFRLNFDLHRAGGLWLWPILFIFGWSSVFLGLRQVYDPVTKALFDYQTDAAEFGKYLLPMPLEKPALGWHEAERAGERLMAQVAAENHFTVTRPYGMAYIPSFGVYTYGVRSSRDIRAHGWDTSIWVDANTGELREVSLPSGQHTGNTISTWLWGIHYADLRDFLPFRVFVCVLGLLLVVLSVTGVYIWWKKRKGRLLAASRAKSSCSLSPSLPTRQIVIGEQNESQNCR
jgi:uncharacterized iron-regulated membrane protein